LEKAGYKLSKKTFDNEIWPAFRRVSHFWAAYFKRCNIDLQSPFPCRGEDLRSFLSDTQVYQRMGEKNPFLRPGETVKLPARLKV
jgi:hypothetical protein